MSVRLTSKDSQPQRTYNAACNGVLGSDSGFLFVSMFALWSLSISQSVFGKAFAKTKKNIGEPVGNEKEKVT